MIRVDRKPMPFKRTAILNGRSIQDAAYRNWLTANGLTMRAQYHTGGLSRYPEGPIHARLGISATSYTIDLTPFAPDGASRRHGLRGDLDNYAKAILDAAGQAGLYTDDRQIERLDVWFE